MTDGHIYCMPNGEVHHKYFMRGYLVEIPVSIALIFVDFQFAIGNIIGYSCGRWVDPDWDIMGTNNAEGRMVKELPLIGHFLYGISSTYGSIFRRLHRSFITHFPFVSTAIRWWFVMLLPYLITERFGFMFFYGVERFWLGTWVGLSQADAIHWWLDKSYGD